MSKSPIRIGSISNPLYNPSNPGEMITAHLGNKPEANDRSFCKEGMIFLDMVCYKLVITTESRWWFQIFFYLHPYLGKISILINIFQMGWNHQPVSSIAQCTKESRFWSLLRWQHFKQKGPHQIAIVGWCRWCLNGWGAGIEMSSFEGDSSLVIVLKVWSLVTSW